MNRLARALLALLPALLLGACATHQSKYDWGNYDPSLYAYYKSPAKAPEYASALEAIINGADSGKGVVPPGIYAEYGYLQLQQGKAEDAVIYFRLEQRHWPESTVFMDHLIQVASGSLKAAPAKGL